MRILFVTTIPFSVVCGGTIYSSSLYNSFTRLVGRNNVDIFILSDNQKIKNRALRKLYSFFYFFYSRIPVNVLFHSGFVKVNTKLVSNKYNIVIFDHIESTMLIDEFNTDLKIYLAQNIEHRLKKFDSKYFAQLESLHNNFMRIFEEKISSTVDRVITISNNDFKYFRGFNQFVTVVPPSFRSFNPYKCRLRENSFMNLGFIGGAKWYANRDAVEYILLEILPLLPADFSYKLTLAGYGWHRFLSTIKTSDAVIEKVEMLGFIDDINEFWSQIDVFVAPLRYGEGVNIKVCEALHCGCAVVGTNVAFRGMSTDLFNSNQFFVADTAAEFAQSILGCDGRKFKGNYFSTDRIDSILHSIIK